MGENHENAKRLRSGTGLSAEPEYPSPLSPPGGLMSQPDPFGFIGLTYDDVMLLPGHTDVIPSEANTTSRLTRRIDLSSPLLSSMILTRPSFAAIFQEF